MKLQERLEHVLLAVAKFRTTALSAALGGVIASIMLAAWSCQSIERVPVDWAAIESMPDPDIRVRLERRASQATVGGSESMLVGVGGPEQGRRVAGPLKVSVADAEIRVIDRSGKTHRFPATAPVSVRGVSDKGPAGPLEIGERRYPGLIRFVPRGADDPRRMDIVNVTTVERYLPGVLAAELFSSWHLEAFKAQAVAARSYALAQREGARQRGRWYDLDDHVGDQAYVGLVDVENANLGTLMTRGRVIVDENGVVKAYYSSTCGGRPALAGEIWPTQPGSFSIRRVADRELTSDRETLCQDAPLYNWRVKRSRSALSSRISAWGNSVGRKDVARLGRLRSISVLEKSDSGRPIEYELTDVRGNRARLGAEHLRVACNSTAGGHSSPSKNAKVHSSDLRFALSVSSIRINGRGSGHGVGLCQYCASRMAKRGDDSDEMLDRFYPATDIQKLY